MQESFVLDRTIDRIKTKISTDYDLLWLNGMLAIFYMSLTAVLVWKVLWQ